MRVVHVVCVYPPYKAGMGQVAFEMCQALRARGHDVIAVTPRYKKNIPPDPTVVRLPTLASYGNGAFTPGLFKALEGAELVHFHYPFFGAHEMIASFKTLHPNIPLVLSYHMEPVTHGFLGMIFRLSQAVVLPRLLRAADACIASTFDYMQTTSATRHFARYPHIWHEIPFGVDPLRFSIRPKKQILIDRFGLRKDFKTILFVGGMDEAHAFKGIPILLQAISILKKRGERVQLLLVGDGSHRVAYEKEASTLHIEDVTHFTGRVSDDELPYMYNLADVFTLPSVTRGEAFGLVLLEAMASGVPVVASDLPGLRTVAKKGHGRVVPPGNPALLAQALQDQLVTPWSLKDQTQLREDTVALYSWDRIADTLMDLYQRVAERHAPKVY